MRTKLMVIIAILLASLVCYIPAEAVQTLDLFSDQNIVMGLDYRDGNRVLRSSTVKINPDVIETMEGVEKGRDLSSIQLSLTFFSNLRWLLFLIDGSVFPLPVWP